MLTSACPASEFKHITKLLSHRRQGSQGRFSQIRTLRLDVAILFTETTGPHWAILTLKNLSIEPEHTVNIFVRILKELCHGSPVHFA